MVRRIAVLGALAAALLLVWLEFGIVSPWHRSVRTAYDNYRVEKLRADWRPPCQSDAWSYPEVEGVMVPVPACLEYEVMGPNRFEDGVELQGTAGVTALDRKSSDARLVITLRTARPGGDLNRTPFYNRGDSCGITRDDDVFLARCFGARYALVGGKWLAAWWDLPWYLEDGVRDRQEEVLGRIVGEFVRLHSGSDVAGESAAWRGIDLPPGSVLGEEQSGNTGYSIDLLLRPGLNIRQFEADFRDDLDPAWRACDSEQSVWPLTQGEATRRAFWIDKGRRVILGLAVHEGGKTTDNADAQLVLWNDGERWELFHRGTCAGRDRDLYSLLAVEMALQYCDAAAESQAFDRAAWRTGDAETRGSMTADLVCRGYLLGLGRDEVTDVLGPPDRESGATMGYRVHSREGFKQSTLPPLPADCGPGWYDLEFDYSVDVPGQGAQVFHISEVCGETAGV